MRGQNHVGNEPINCVVIERSQCTDDIWEVQSVHAMEHPEELFLVRDFLDHWKAELRYPGNFLEWGHRRVRIAKIVFDDSTIIDDTSWKLPEDEAQRIKALAPGQKC